MGVEERATVAGACGRGRGRGQRRRLRRRDSMARPRREQATRRRGRWLHGCRSLCGLCADPLPLPKHQAACITVTPTVTPITNFSPITPHVTSAVTPNLPLFNAHPTFHTHSLTTQCRRLPPLHTPLVPVLAPREAPSPAPCLKTIALSPLTPHNNYNSIYQDTAYSNLQIIPSVQPLSSIHSYPIV